MRRVVAPDTISLDEIRLLAQARFGDMIKGVVDLERGVLLLDADLHADQEAALLADGGACRLPSSSATLAVRSAARSGGRPGIPKWPRPPCTGGSS